MGNACGGCCSWAFASDDASGKDGKRTKTVLLDEENTWFEHDTTPLVSARYDDDAIGSDSVVTKTVVMRSPRATSASSATSAVVNKAHSPREASTPARSADGGASSASHRPGRIKKAPSRGLVCIDKSDEESDSQLTERSSHDAGRRKDSHEHRHSHRSSSVESSRGSTGSFSMSSVSVSSTFEVVERNTVATRESLDSDLALAPSHRASRDDSTGDDSAREQEQSSHESPPKSPSSKASPKKARYGRKNYRANSSRKKDV